MQIGRQQAAQDITDNRQIFLRFNTGQQWSTPVP